MISEFKSVLDELITFLSNLSATDFNAEEDICNIEMNVYIVNV